MALYVTSGNGVPLSSMLSDLISKPSPDFSLFSDLISDLSSQPGDAKLRVDWVETADAHVLKVDLPGLGKDDIKVEVEAGGMLKISGERKREEIQEGDKWHRAERSQGSSFMRKFKLPGNVDVDGTKAEAANGVLTVTVPKLSKPEASAQTIQVL